MQIWLHGNLDVHVFIPASFWRGHFEIVRDMLPQAELYVHENEATRQIDGFIGLTENHIEGIFVVKSARSKGIGKALLEYVKSRKTALDAERLPEKRACNCVLPARAVCHTFGRHRRGYERSGDSDALDTVGTEKLTEDGQPSSVLSICKSVPQIVL